MINESFVSKVLTGPCEGAKRLTRPERKKLIRRWNPHNKTPYPRWKAARVNDPLHFVYLIHTRRVGKAKRRGTPYPLWKDALHDAGIMTPEDVERYVKNAHKAS